MTFAGQVKSFTNNTTLAHIEAYPLVELARAEALALAGHVEDAAPHLISTLKGLEAVVEAYQEMLEGYILDEAGQRHLWHLPKVRGDHRPDGRPYKRWVPTIPEAHHRINAARKAIKLIQVAMDEYSAIEAESKYSQPPWQKKVGAPHAPEVGTLACDDPKEKLNPKTDQLTDNVCFCNMLHTASRVAERTNARV